MDTITLALAGGVVYVQETYDTPTTIDDGGSAIVRVWGLRTADGTQAGMVDLLPAGKLVVGWFLAFPPVVAGDTLYTRGGAGLVAEHASLSGASRWSFSGVDLAGPVLSGGTLYASGWDGNTDAIRASDGHALWRTHTGGGATMMTPTPGQPHPIGQYVPINVAPAVSDGAVFAVGDTTVHALRASDGTEVWSYDTQGAPIESSPIVG